MEETIGRAIVFPGQGSQAVGMGKGLAEVYAVAREVFSEVDDVLNKSLSKLMFSGPSDELMLTENAQPALLACSVAIFRVIESELAQDALFNKLKFVAGHSLGEYSALCAAGTFSLSDAIKLVELRGKTMQLAVPIGEGSMAAILGLTSEEVEQVAIEASAVDICNFANDNAPGQSVLSGAKAAVEKGIELAKIQGAKKAIMLPVSAPFHSALMDPATKVMTEALSKVGMQSPQIPLVSNICANEVTSVDEIRENLVKQVCGRVRWRESVLYMKNNGINEIIELGHGKVLSGMVRRIDKTIATGNASEPKEIEALIREYF